MIPEVNGGRSTLPLRVFADLIMGQAPVGDSYNDAGHGLPLIAGAGDLGQLTPEPKKWTDSPTKVGQQGDIIVCVRATIGDLNRADRPYCYGRGVAAVRVKSGCEPHFIWYWLEACKEHLHSLGRGATFKQISKEDLAELPTPDLPLPEQRRLVSRIKVCMERVEEIETLRAGAEQEAAAITPSLLNEVFVDVAGRAPSRSIDEVALETRYGTSQKCHTEPSGVPILRIPNVAAGSVNFDPLKYCELSDEELRRVQLVPGDLLFVRTNGSRDLVGRCAVFEPRMAEEPVGFASYLIRVRLDPNQVLPRYLAYFLNSTKGREEINQRRRTSAGQFNINSENLRSISLPVPPVQEQARLIAMMEERDQLASQLTGELQAAAPERAQLRESILRKAFAGEL